MTDVAHILAALDQQIAGLQELRARVAKEQVCGEPEPEWMETGDAAVRFNLPKDTVRAIARRHGCGRKIGGRWEIEMGALQAYMAGRCRV